MDGGKTKTGHLVSISPDHVLSIDINHRLATRPVKRPAYTFMAYMRHSFAASWLRAILFACFFLGVFARSLSWLDNEFAIHNPVKSQEALQDIVS
jgi:hypothetical protein